MTASHIDLFTIDDNGQFQLASAGQVIEAALAILDEKVMRNGLIVEQGRFETLAHANSHFAALLAHRQEEI